MEQSGAENLDVILGTVSTRLRDMYPLAIPADFKPILKTALSGKWCGLSDQVGGYDPKTLQLVRLEYSQDGSWRRLVLPYIWIFMALTMKGTPSDLAKWSLDNYVQMKEARVLRTFALVSKH